MTHSAKVEMPTTDIYVGLREGVVGLDPQKGLQPVRSVVLKVGRR